LKIGFILSECEGNRELNSCHLTSALSFKPVQLAMSTMANDFRGKAKTYGKKQAMAVCKLRAGSPGYLSYDRLVDKLGDLAVK
jgi:hypothetical protein